MRAERLFTRLVQHSHFGPKIAVARDDVVAVEQAEFDQQLQTWRTLLHMRGGSTLLVQDPFDDARAWLAGDRDE